MIEPDCAHCGGWRITMNRAIDLSWAATAGNGAHVKAFAANAAWNPLGPSRQAPQRTGG